MRAEHTERTAAIAVGALYTLVTAAGLAVLAVGTPKSWVDIAATEGGIWAPAFLERVMEGTMFLARSGQR